MPHHILLRCNACVADVECVATGTDHNARVVAHISLVDQYEQVIANLYVKPEQPVVSYLTALTGVTAAHVQQQGLPLEQAISILKASLPKTAILVGQNINKDVQWLGLKEGVDFAGMVDLAGLWRVWNEQYKSWSVFGQDHIAKVRLRMVVVGELPAAGSWGTSVRCVRGPLPAAAALPAALQGFPPA